MTTSRIRHVLSVPLAVLYIALIPFAAWLVERYGVQPVGLGFYAPAGVFAVGAILVVRDLLQDQLHVLLGSTLRVVASMVGFIAVGTLLAVWVDPRFGAASGVAFLVSELLDTAVYTPLRNKGKLGAVLVSNAVGIVADSLLFLTIAFGSLAFLSGQVYGKSLATLVGIAVIAVVREFLERRRDDLPFNVVDVA